MAKEVTAKAATIEEAVAKAVAELGVGRDDCQIEVMEAPRKSLFGKMKDAVVRVTASDKSASDLSVPDKPAPDKPDSGKPAPDKSDSDGFGTGRPASFHTPVPAAEKIAQAKEYLNGIFNAMNLSGVFLNVIENDEGAVIRLEGEGLAVLIGHHGETLDALQYLVALVCNRLGGDYYRLTLDCGSYREKREETLRSLAGRIAEKVKKTGRSQLLEPMNPYERRIIHSVVSEVEGITSKSRGEEPNRRVVILSEHPTFRSAESAERERNDDRRPCGTRPAPPPPRARERTMEEILKGDFKNEFKEKEETAELYSKIEL